MFYIIKTPRNYFTRELLHDSNVAFHCIVSHWRPYWEVSCSEKYSVGPVLPLCTVPHALHLSEALLNIELFIPQVIYYVFVLFLLPHETVFHH